MEMVSGTLSGSGSLSASIQQHSKGAGNNSNPDGWNIIPDLAPTRPLRLIKWHLCRYYLRLLRPQTADWLLTSSAPLRRAILLDFCKS
jgi:hypothetical protein